MTMESDDAPALNMVPFRTDVEALVKSAGEGIQSARRRLIRLAIDGLRSHASLEPAVADHVADALEAIQAQPGDAAELLGVKRGQGAPPRDRVLREYAGAKVSKFMAAGVPLKDGRPRAGWDGEGAISRAVQECRDDGLVVTEAQAKRGYGEYRRWRARLHANREAARRRLQEYWNAEGSPEDRT